mmetsp:Transcript_63596/g.139378  ORF Transcript_63596/g.139378 Transcript_63596/m.139378 type:complete len:98 (+) Transcript_63596:61-354(+)
MEKQQAATFCMILSAWAVPLLLFFGFLCYQGSPMIELETKVKREAAYGCFGSAALYAFTFFGAYSYKKRLIGSVLLRPEFMELPSLTERRPRNSHID